jgi:hypothetical protein
MVWVLLVLAAVSWLVVSIISEQERDHGSLSLPSRVSARLLKLIREWPRLRSMALGSSTQQWRSGAVPSGRPVRGDGWRSRLIALIELILFVVLISAVFAGAMAAAALRIGHFGT